MSRFFSSKFDHLEAYVPGEQPKDKKYVKLNTNESPYPPSDGTLAAIRDEAGKLNLYSDPECSSVVSALAGLYGVPKECVIATNGSDEVLNFAFMAFSDKDHPIVFPDITYGFYPVFAELNAISYEEIPLREDFTINPDDYVGIGKNIVIANPNAPTGISLPLSEIERIVSTNPDNVVIIDEAYVDFGGESAIPLTQRYPNLIVTGTFSKSRSLAGARLGFGIASPPLIRDMNTIRFSTNPYNVNRMTLAAGAAAIKDNDYYMQNALKIIENREQTAKELKELGFEMTDSRANFIFAKSDMISGEQLYKKLRMRGILVRHFKKPRIAEYNRITVGTAEEMRIFVDAVRDILHNL